MNIPNYDDDGPIAEPAYPPTELLTTDEFLTKRERFAMAAMQGLCANPDLTKELHDDIGQWAVRIADFTIEKLKEISP